VNFTVAVLACLFAVASDHPHSCLIGSDWIGFGLDLVWFDWIGLDLV